MEQTISFATVEYIWPCSSSFNPLFWCPLFFNSLFLKHFYTVLRIRSTALFWMRISHTQHSNVGKVWVGGRLAVIESIFNRPPSFFCTVNLFFFSLDAQPVASRLPLPPQSRTHVPPLTVAWLEFLCGKENQSARKYSECAGILKLKGLGQFQTYKYIQVRIFTHTFFCIQNETKFSQIAVISFYQRPNLYQTCHGENNCCTRFFMRQFDIFSPAPIIAW